MSTRTTGISGFGRIGFFGIGKSNLSLMRTLDLSGADITLRSDTEIEISSLPDGISASRIFTGAHVCDGIDEEIIFFSPSVRRERDALMRAKTRGVVFSSDAELFFKENKSPLFSVTGSDGKSTTATLAGELLSGGGLRTALIGNIGHPMFESLTSDADAFVAELSSFMLRYAQPKSRRACITNITPNHLDFHESFEEYRDSKLALLSKCNECVLSADDGICLKFARAHGTFAAVSYEKSFDELRGLIKAELYVTAEDGYIKRNGVALLGMNEILRREVHNVKNLMCAIAITDGFTGIDVIRKCAAEYRGLAHRCETVYSAGGIDFIDSSIDSTPARTAATLESLGRRAVVILGGRGKGVPFSPLVPHLKKYAAHVIAVGECAEDIVRELSDEVTCERPDDFDSAVIRAIELARTGDAVLLSPAATSYDSFKNFEERGDRFKKLVTDYYKA